ncbi:MAG: antitoxin Xre/MbcA/ParS toxin-binding domain-containing protein [Ginsengibacter sp.]
MNSVKNKSGTLQKKDHRTSQIVVTVAPKKINGVVKYKNQNALAKEFFMLKEISGFNNENLAGLLGTTHRTIHNKKNSGEPFDIAQTERLRKLSRLFKEGYEIFSNKKEFSEWLGKPAYGLDYAIPYDLLQQPGGLDSVMDELYAIKFGDTI